MSDIGHPSPIITRVASLGRDMFRAYKIYIGNEVVGEVKRGRETQIALPPGEDLVHMKIDWCASPQARIEIAAGSGFRLACGPSPSGKGRCATCSATPATISGRARHDESSGVSDVVRLVASGSAGCRSGS